MSLARPAQTFTDFRGQIVRFSLSGLRLPPLMATVRVAESFRSAALAAFQVVAGHRESFLLSGHRADGRPDHRHRHGFYLPTPDEKGSLVAVYLVSPIEPFSREEMEALKLISVLRWNGPTTRVKIELTDENDGSLSQVAWRWSTATPYVPPRRFYGTHGKHHLVPEKQVVEELRELVPGSYEVEEIREVPGWQIEVRLANENNKVRQPLRRQGFYVRFRAGAPLCGPIVLGHSTHFGLGQFGVVLE